MAEPTDERAQIARIFKLAWEHALSDGISEDIIASTALTAALGSLAKRHGNEAAARMAEQFAKAVREGHFH